MDFQEKVGLWNFQSEDKVYDKLDEVLDDGNVQRDVHISEDNNLDNLDNLESLDDDDELLPHTALYRRLIEESGAFKWLLAQLQNAVHLFTPWPRNIKQEIRKGIQSQLPSQFKFSRSDLTQVIKAEYNVVLDLVGFLVEQEYTGDLGDAFGNVITITGNDKYAQTETCMNYLCQTWPLLGQCLVHVLKCAVRSTKGLLHTCNSEDGTVLTACIQTGMLKVAAVGSRDSIADVGEQLAWLGSSLQQPPTPDGTSCSLVFANLRPIPHNKFQPLGVAVPQVEVEYTITFDLQTFEGPYRKSKKNGTCWHNLFLHPVIAMGFPIPARDVSKYGLEIPLHIMATLAQAKRVTLYDGKMYAKGFSTVLFPTQKSEDIISWHLLYNEDRKRLSYNDSRIEDTSIGDLTFKDLETSRHIVGWTSSAKTFAGAPEANHSIQRSGLSSRDAGCVLEKVSLSVGKIVNGGASVAVGIKDVPLHLKREGSYVDQIQDAYNNYVIFYDVDDKRSWLVNSATALLHIVRVSLHENMTGPFRSHYLFDPTLLTEATTTHTPQSAIEVLTNQSNMELKILRGAAEIWTETTNEEDGKIKVIEKRKDKFVHFQDRVDEKWHILEQILDQQSKSSSGGVRLSMPGRQYLEGFDFVDVASRISDLRPRVTQLQARGKAWVDFIRSIRAVTLFGRGFGELIQPSENSNELCHHWLKVPAQKDYLVVSVSDLEGIARRRGDPDATPMILVDDICWHKPDKLFETCSCKSPQLKRKYSGLKSLSDGCERVQVLLPAKAGLGRLVSPGPIDRMRNGAVIFGYTKAFSLRWADHGVPKREELSPEPEELQLSPYDSGLGSSLQSSTSEREASPKRQRSRQ
ncbi:hypothetical protein CC80DRAFT_428143 [Byssothecium circinans]|uniref:Uncharacterized protein n=1 Tax=Byssothecium circinans TaxID=147558 RepID=A0A6A5TCA0_9PLEO|nr:hypothetical protein CC80DRAFT_428143 [Byssothecium circinans]